MRKRGRILALLEAGFLVMGAGAAYGAQAGPGDGLIRTEDGRTERAEAPGETEKETERAEETAGESALPAVPEGLPDGDVLSDPAIAGDTDKIIVVRGQGGSAVRTAYYRAEDGAWGQVFETSGVWGLNGCSADKVEGDKKTPTGVYRFNLAFGILDDPGAVLPYHKVTAEDYWVDDPESRYYNRLVDASRWRRTGTPRSISWMCPPITITPFPLPTTRRRFRERARPSSFTAPRRDIRDPADVSASRSRR